MLFRELQTCSFHERSQGFGLLGPSCSRDALLTHVPVNTNKSMGLPNWTLVKLLGWFISSLTGFTRCLLISLRKTHGTTCKPRHWSLNINIHTRINKQTSKRINIFAESAKLGGVLEVLNCPTYYEESIDYICDRNEIEVWETNKIKASLNFFPRTYIFGRREHPMIQCDTTLTSSERTPLASQV